MRHLDDRNAAYRSHVRSQNPIEKTHFLIEWITGGVKVQLPADWYRAQANECLARSEQTTDQRVKAINKDMADTWLRLAELVEKLDANPAP